MIYWLIFLSVLLVIVSGYAAIITFIQLEDEPVKRADRPRVLSIAAALSLGVVLALTTISSVFFR